MLTVIEKVIALQNVDMFSEVSTEQLSHLAAIAEEITLEEGETLYKESDPPNAMYLILEGRVRQHRKEVETITGPGEALGLLALLGDEPMVFTATPMESTLLLRIYRDDFFDLLGEYVQITQGVLKVMVKKWSGLRVMSREVGESWRDSG